MSNLPFTFSWVFEDQTTFDPNTMGVFDEDIFSFDIKHDEGQVPTLDMVIRNPRIGLLNPGRKVWGWFAWQKPDTTLLPLFFGVLVGVPTDLFKEKVSIQLIARSPQFIANKQAVAETMKSVPYYDPIWIDTARRDDPDTILEGWSALWHIDRTTLDITASDILVGEDGTAIFDEDHAFYDSVSLKLGQPPLTNIRVEATVNWSQRTSGFFDVPAVNISSYTGDTLISDWPKPGSGIGGGYICETSFVNDTFKISQTPSTSYSASNTNSDPNPGQCSTASVSVSSSGPALLSPNALTAVLTQYYQSGLCFPTADPPQNRPMTSTASGIIVPLWNMGATMTLRYDASRQYSEVLSFDMLANTQGILTSPTVAQDTELLTLSSVDVSQPLIEVDAWTDFAGGAVEIAQIVFANNPTTPGGLAYQICIQAGVAGLVEPVFSDIVGETTNDGTVIWASMGENPLTNAPRWSQASFVPLGQITLMQNQFFNINTGEYENIPGATSYYICTVGGKTNGVYRDFTYTPPLTTNTQAPPALRHISVIDPPTFSQTIGQHVQDGSVTWTVLGLMPRSLGIPIGGTIDNITARSFFPTPRGLQAVEYLISKARARLRFRSRAVTVGWDCRFQDAVDLSCRMNATLFDPRLPGGAATGKITGYVLSGSGDGKVRGHVEVGCPVGFGDSIVEITGTPVYVNEGYVKKGYQQYKGSMIAHGSNETTYSPPVFVPFDDGLHFPLRWQDVSDGGRLSGSLAEQKAAIEKSFTAARTLAFINAFGGSISGGTAPNNTLSGVPADTAWQLQAEALALTTQNTPYIMAANPVSWSCLLKPCAGNGPFGGSYAIQVSPLVVPQGINLEAPSSP